MLRQLKKILVCLLAFSVLNTGTLQSARAWIAAPVTVLDAHGLAVESPHGNHDHDHRLHGTIDLRHQLECFLVCLDGAPDEYIPSLSIERITPDAEPIDFGLIDSSVRIAQLSVSDMRPLPRGPPGHNDVRTDGPRATLLLTARFRI